MRGRSRMFLSTLFPIIATSKGHHQSGRFSYIRQVDILISVYEAIILLFVFDPTEDVKHDHQQQAGRFLPENLADKEPIIPD